MFFLAEFWQYKKTKAQKFFGWWQLVFLISFFEYPELFIQFVDQKSSLTKELCWNFFWCRFPEVLKHFFDQEISPIKDFWLRFLWNFVNIWRRWPRFSSKVVPVKLARHYKKRFFLASFLEYLELQTLCWTRIFTNKTTLVKMFLCRFLLTFTKIGTSNSRHQEKILEI